MSLAGGSAPYKSTAEAIENAFRVKAKLSGRTDGRVKIRREGVRWTIGGDKGTDDERFPETMRPGGELNGGRREAMDKIEARCARELPRQASLAPLETKQRCGAYIIERTGSRIARDKHRAWRRL